MVAKMPVSNLIKPDSAHSRCYLGNSMRRRRTAVVALLALLLLRLWSALRQSKAFIMVPTVSGGQESKRILKIQGKSGEMERVREKSGKWPCS